MKLFRGWQGAEAAADRTSAPAGPDNGPVIVLVDEHTTDVEALEWATAEAAARGSELRIVYAFRFPRLLDPVGNPTVDLQTRESAEDVVTVAVRRARRIAPDLRIRTHVFPGRQVTALVTEAREGDRGLVVLGHGRRSRLERSLTRRLARGTTASLAVIGLSKQGAVGPSAGRVVVGVDDNGGPPAVLGFAFRAARRRGTGLTVVHAAASSRRRSVEDAVQIWRMAYPEVDVQWDFTRGPIDSAVLAESPAAALTVLGADRHAWLHRVVRGSASYNVLRLARGPVVMVGTV
ncbi:universal stress protein [Kribbella sp. NPDC049227]|uniref:universal stress protein n=1 Tax=Kribbella sp. NPDC049227 TaxID=3364113 RepID=UPI00371FAA72